MATIADLKAHEALMQARKQVKANKKAKTFVDKVSMRAHTHTRVLTATPTHIHAGD